MDIFSAMKERHSVRQYTEKPIEKDVAAQLQNEIDCCNKEGGLHIQLIMNEPKAFDGMMAHYGKFSGVKNYIALIGPKSSDLSEKCGYYGQKIAVKAQQLGLNTCWVAMSYSRVPRAMKIDKGEKLTVVIAVGYGKTQGVPHKSKSGREISNVSENSPEWFKNGVEAALLAPTALNQQKFYLDQAGSKVKATAKTAFYSKMDLGIVKYNFEIGAGKENFDWA